VAPGRKRRAAGLTPKGLDRFSLTMLAIANESMHVCVCDPEVQTLLIGTGEAFGGYPSAVLLGGFSPQARDAQAEALAFQPTREGRPDDRRGNRLGCGA
jgi:hypothetical protein